jgi:hypothetical protein
MKPNPAIILSAVEAALESAIPATLAVNLVDFNTVTKWPAP